MAGFGVSFVPSDQNTPNQQRPFGQAGGAPPLQQAIQLLSLRLPRVVGSQGLAPGPLLQSPGASGLEQLLRFFGQQGQMTNAPGAMSAPSLPPPHIIPGLDKPGTGIPSQFGGQAEPTDLADLRPNLQPGWRNDYNPRLPPIPGVPGGTTPGGNGGVFGGPMNDPWARYKPGPIGQSLL